MNFRFHIIPIGDEIIHSAGGNLCECAPTHAENGNMIHNAADCREVAEGLTGEACSPGWILIKELL